jgi:hypothetical protein
MDHTALVGWSTHLFWFSSQLLSTANGMVRSWALVLGEFFVHAGSLAAFVVWDGRDGIESHLFSSSSLIEERHHARVGVVRR